MKKIDSKKRKKWIVSLGVLLFFMFISFQTSMNRLFYTIDPSKDSEEKIEFKFKISSIIHFYSYEFSDSYNGLLLRKKGDSLSQTITYADNILFIYNPHTSRLNRNNAEKDDLIQEGITYDKAKNVLGTPTTIIKNRNNIIVLATWRGKDFAFYLSFDDTETCTNVEKNKL